MLKTYIAATTQVLRKVLDLLQSPRRPCQLPALHQVGDGGGVGVGHADVHYFGDYFHLLPTLGQNKTEKLYNNNYMMLVIDNTFYSIDEFY